jgi:hypothetical protein
MPLFFQASRRTSGPALRRSPALDVLAGFAACLVAGCGVSSPPIDDAPGGTSSGEAAPTASDAPGASDAPAAPKSPDGAAGPRLTLALRGSTASFTHADGLSGQTAKMQIAAIKALWLLREDDDPAPVKVFDLGDAPVPVDYVSNAAVTLATVARTSLPSGTYRRAKVEVAWVRYRVAARMHANGVVIDGDYENVQALSRNVRIEGATRDRGWFRYTFLSGGASLGSLEGTGAPTPAVATSGGVTLDTSGPEAFYTFGVDAAFDASAPYDETVTFEANVANAFRWKDVPYPGNAPGVFDTSPTSFEPVMSFGANAYAVTFARRAP